MKNLFRIFSCIALASALFVSCDIWPKDEPVEPVVVNDGLSVVSCDLEYLPEGGTGTIVASKSSSLAAVSDKTWCSVSVVGATVNVTVAPYTGKESRYSKITLTSGDETTDVTICQFGEVVGGLSDLGDITAPVEGDVVKVPVKLNVPIKLETVESWIHPSYENNLITIVVDPNSEPMTRMGTVRYEAGSVSGFFEVTQYPEFKRAADWTLALGDVPYKYPYFEPTVIATVPGSDYYYLAFYPASEVPTDVASWIFAEVAPKMRNELIAKVEAAPGSSFVSYLSSGNTSQVFGGQQMGDAYIIAVGFGSNGLVSGKYQFQKVTIADTRPMYYKWTGKWTLSGKAIDGSAYTETVELLVDETDVDADGKQLEKYLVARGLGSKNAIAAGLVPGEGYEDVYVIVNDDYSITFYGQNCGKKFTHPDRGAGCYLQLISMYIKAGATSYTNVTGGKFMTLKMRDDLKTTDITILERSAGLPFKAFRYRLVNSSGSAYTIGGNAATISLDENLTFSR